MNSEIAAKTFDDQMCKSVGGAWGFPIATLVALYFLAIGPAVSRPIEPSVQHAVECIYWPVFFVARNVPPLAAALEWYMALWEYHIRYDVK
jgi:hypothetical protein